MYVRLLGFVIFRVFIGLRLMDTFDVILQWKIECDC